MIAGAQSIYRTIDIIETLFRAQNGLSARDVAKATELSLSTAHRILNVLHERGLVKQEKQTRLYYPGNMWLNSGKWNIPRMLTNRYGDLPFKLVEAFGHTGYLFCRVGYRCLCLERAESLDSVQVFTARPGGLRLLGDGAGTFGILGFLDPEEQEAVLRVTLPEFEDRLLRGEAELLAEIRDARSKGYSFGHDHKVAGTAAVAVPIYHEGEVVGALSLSGIFDDKWREAQGAMIAMMRQEVAARSW